MEGDRERRTWSGLCVSYLYFPQLNWIKIRVTLLWPIEDVCVLYTHTHTHRGPGQRLKLNKFNHSLAMRNDISSEWHLFRQSFMLVIAFKRKLQSFILYLFLFPSLSFSLSLVLVYSCCDSAARADGKVLSATWIYRPDSSWLDCDCNHLQINRENSHRGFAWRPAGMERPRAQLGRGNVPHDPGRVHSVSGPLFNRTFQKGTLQLQQQQQQ